jgi:hypothetical protein
VTVAVAEGMVGRLLKGGGGGKRGFSHGRRGREEEGRGEERRGGEGRGGEGRGGEGEKRIEERREEKIELNQLLSAGTASFAPASSHENPKLPSERSLRLRKEKVLAHFHD